MAQRLNLALVNKVEELQRYRSEFFGRLREVLGNRADVRIVGDRFVFQSELLFPTASARLEPSGKDQLDKLAETLKEIIAKMPQDVDWILRVDGHTDVRRINTLDYPSNWELSTARATAVVKYLVSQGIPPDRLAATGFGEFQPIDHRQDRGSLPEEPAHRVQVHRALRRAPRAAGRSAPSPASAAPTSNCRAASRA